jgi:uncharacterized protein
VYLDRARAVLGLSGAQPAVLIPISTLATDDLTVDTRLARVPGMKPRISVLTLGVADLEQSLEFYRDGLGLPTKGIVGREFAHGAVAFFDLSGGLKLAIWAQGDLAHDSGLPATPPSPTSFSIGHNVASAEDVDRVVEQASRSGAEIVKVPQDTFYGGYAGYFRDPNGHLWEVVWNPANIPDD